MSETTTAPATPATEQEKAETRQVRKEVAAQIVKRLDHQHTHPRMTKRETTKRDEAAVELACGAWIAAIAILGEKHPHAQAISFVTMMASVRGYNELVRLATEEG